MPIPESIIKQIAEKADIGEIVSQYTSLKRKGNRYWGLCPFHHEKTASFSVKPDSGFYYCFGCQKGGTVFNFVMEIENLSFTEAVEFLGRKVGIQVTKETAETSEREKVKDALRELFRRVAGSYHYLLTESSAGERARAYLKNRCLGDDIIKQFAVGYAPNDPFWLHAFLEKKNYSKDFLRPTGLFTAKNPSRSFFVDRIMFPIHSPQGDVIAFGGRLIEGDGPKYLNSAESDLYHKSENLYGLFQAKEAIRKEKTVVLVEGYMDVLALHQAGIANAVAPLGTAFTPEQGRFLRRFADSIILFFDGDAAGLKAVWRTAEICERLEFNIRAVEAPKDRDPADFLQNGQIEELQNIVKYSINILDFLLKKTRSPENKEAPEGKELVIRELFPYIDSMVSEVKRDAAITKIADAHGIEKAAVQSDFVRSRRQSPSDEAQGRSVRNVAAISLNVDLVLMLAAAAKREYFHVIRSRLTLEDFEDPNGREMYIGLEECYRRNEWNPEEMIQNLENTELKSFIISKLVSDEFSYNQEKLVKDGIVQIRRRSLMKQRDVVVRDLRKQERDGSRSPEDTMTALLEKKMYLDGELEKLRMSENE